MTFEPLTGVFTARSAIEFVVSQTVHPERVEGLVRCPFHATRSPASYHRAVASESFLKTHVMAASVN
jgi:hypothetical protein